MLALQKLARSHEILMYLCALLSFLAVATGGLGFLMNGFFILCWAFSWFAHGRGWTEKVPTQIWNGIILTTVAITGAQMYLTEESIITIGVRFILLLLIIKLFSRKGGERDDWQIYALTFLLMAAGTAINEDVAYGVVFALYVFFVTFGLALFHMYTETSRLEAKHIRRGGMARVYQVALVLLSGAVFLSSVTIFFVFPRVGLGFFAPKTRSAQAMTGFSDKVELGSHGVIRDNPEVVLRVEFPDGKMPPSATNYHWRMISFDSYDGVKWERSNKGRGLNLSFDAKTRTYDLSQLYTKKLDKAVDDSGYEPRKIRVYMEPLGVSQGPQIWPMQSYVLPQTIPLPFNPKAAWLRHDAYYQDLYIQQRNEVGLIVEMYVQPEPNRELFEDAVFDTTTDKGAAEVASVEPFMQLPEGMNRMRQLSSQVTSSAPTPYKKAELIKEYLQANYTYTTNLPPVDKNNPVEGFLFDSKKGHCEFFATSMALMLRASGVPARVVNGFLGGVWNSAGEYMAVRQGDAHAWVEVYIPEYGWVPFDPTPSAGTQPLQQTGITAQLRDLYDAARMNWMRYVIEYDLDSQIEGLRALSKMLSPNSRSFLDGNSDSDTKEEEEQESEGGVQTRDIILWVVFLLILWRSFRNGRLYFTTSPRTYGGVTLPPAAIIGAGAVLWAGLGLGWMRWFTGDDIPLQLVGGGGPLAMTAIAILLGANFGASRDQLATGLFGDLERAAMRHGITRQTDEGPAAFIARLQELFPAQRAALGKFRALYLGARFGSRELTQEEERQMREAIKAVRREKSPE